MSIEERVALYLKEQYGITACEQLDKALADLPLLDISIFIAPIPQTKKPNREDRKPWITQF